MNLQKPRILLVEDEQLSREALAYILRVEGFVVDTAENGRRGLELLHRRPHPSVVLLDLGLPIVNGQEFLQRQSQDPDVADIPVVVITGMPEATAPEAMAILPKPLDLSRLMILLAAYRDSERSH
jgi:CheY-like chemotaxis protein